MNEKEIILTAEGLQKLQDELDELKTVHRKEVNDRIRQAKEYGDLSENAEYEDAKQEQAFIEGRILKLEAMIRNSRIIDESGICLATKSTSARPSKSKISRTTRATSFTSSARPKPIRRPSASRTSRRSVARLIGHKKGETVDVSTPRGVVKYKIDGIQERQRQRSVPAKKAAKKAS